MSAAFVLLLVNSANATESVCHNSVITVRVEMKLVHVSSSTKTEIYK